MNLLSDGVSTTGELSALFIWVIVFSFLLASFWLFFRSFQARQHLRWLTRLLTAIKPESLPMQRRELRKQATSQGVAGACWLQFDASWVESSDGKHFYQTSDASVFFNKQILSRGVSGNRLLMAMPGILTAFGILGTFVGLQIGLGSLDLGSPQVLSKSIVPLIQGAAVAFATSVWGTIASVLFNFLEKSLEQHLEREINQIQSRANTLFQIHLPEQTLVNIEQSSRESENMLKGLAEQIGDKMQEALLEVPQQIQAGLETAITPAVEKLVTATEALAEKQSDSGQEALSRLIEQFVDSVSESGESSREHMESASSQLSDAITQWSTSMEGFLGRLEHRAGDFDQQVGNLLTQGQTLQRDANSSQQALADVTGEIQKGSILLNQAAQNLGKLGEQLVQGSRLLSESQLQTAKLAETSSRRQQESNQVLERITQTLDQANDGLLVSSQALKESAEISQNSFESLSESQKTFLEQQKKTLTALRKQVGQMMNDYATDVEEQTRHRMDQWNAQTQEFSKGMVLAVNAMNEILGEMDASLSRLRDK
ncbi:anti-phage ZorAB system protein ZorA [Candidatus Venteria ishoeyi]|uniref:anti-phage ZorAB system protein ZorA n=1 Tax=Candidatus Venteria ishoeyi TaxID=1899563 RepID=UPI0011B0E656|nr:anti-phage ZorAB system protein ZorA [Candidatus Venteria ishoeyi]